MDRQGGRGDAGGPELMSDLKMRQQFSGNEDSSRFFGCNMTSSMNRRGFFSDQAFVWFCSTALSFAYRAYPLKDFTVVIPPLSDSLWR